MTEPQSPAIESLVQRAAAGDRGAVAELLTSHLDELQAFVRGRMGEQLLRRETTADIVQSVCREGAETDLALGRGTGIAVTYDWESDRFPIAYATNQTGPTRNLLRGLEYRYPTTAVSTVYGASCSVGTIGSNAPLAGNEYFTVHASGLEVPAPVGVLLLGGASAQIALTGFGMPGCNLLVDPGTLLHLPVTGSSTVLAQALPLPDAPVLRGTFRCQFAYLHAGANQLGLRSTAGLQVTVQ